MACPLVQSINNMECLAEANHHVCNESVEQSPCSICLDALTQQTGIYTSSCGHLFHLGCIGRWILKNENCPNCRSEFVEKEQIAAEKEEEDSEFDSEEGDARDDFEYAGGDANLVGVGLRWRRTDSGRWQVFTRQEIPDFDPQAHAFWVMRKTFELAEEGVELTTQTFSEANPIPSLEVELADRGYETD